MGRALIKPGSNSIEMAPFIHNLPPEQPRWEKSSRWVPFTAHPRSSFRLLTSRHAWIYVKLRINRKSSNRKVFPSLSILIFAPSKHRMLPTKVNITLRKFTWKTILSFIRGERTGEPYWLTTAHTRVPSAPSSPRRRRCVNLTTDRRRQTIGRSGMEAGCCVQKGFPIGIPKSVG